MKKVVTFLVMILAVGSVFAANVAKADSSTVAPTVAQSGSNWFWGLSFPSLFDVKRNEQHLALMPRVEISGDQNGCANYTVSVDHEINLPMPVGDFADLKYLRVSTDVSGARLKDVTQWAAGLTADCMCQQPVPVCNGCFVIDNSGRAGGAYAAQLTAWNHAGHTFLRPIIGNIAIGSAVGRDDVLVKYNIFNPQRAFDEYICRWNAQYPTIACNQQLRSDLRQLAKAYVLFTYAPNLRPTDPGLDYPTLLSFFTNEVNQAANRSVTFRMHVTASRPYTLYVLDQDGGRITPIQRNAEDVVFNLTVTGSQILTYKISGVYDNYQRVNYSDHSEIHEIF